MHLILIEESQYLSISKLDPGLVLACVPFGSTTGTNLGYPNPILYTYIFMLHSH